MSQQQQQNEDESQPAPQGWDLSPYESPQDLASSDLSMSSGVVHPSPMRCNNRVGVVPAE
ncbi:hypothetical protein CDV36_001117 [Fusarium kuroshium]|uniref:Uncharacterized protein n=2 Tax=Fusarium solani species complex TaxID=232080 RepID=A0A3M2SNS2_9HYPO|nr:hypothetical protein CDV36_001117 [Fusarium kuroshium]RSL99151.1 hypothetical protein CDV31_012329 [Fusarium ambrosium]